MINKIYLVILFFIAIVQIPYSSQAAAKIKARNISSQKYGTVVPQLNLVLSGDEWSLYKPQSVALLKDLAGGGVFFESSTQSHLRGLIHQKIRINKLKSILLSLKAYCDELKNDLSGSKQYQVKWVNESKCQVTSPESTQYYTAKAFPLSNDYYYLNIFTFVADSSAGRSFSSVKSNRFSVADQLAMSKMVEGAK